jgi:hypothetical protein
MSDLSRWLLAAPVLMTALEAQEEKIRQRVSDGYFTLWTMGRLAEGVGEALWSKGARELGQSVAVLGERVRQEARAALRRGWVDELDESPWGEQLPWEVLPPDELVRKIGGEVEAITLALALAASMLPVHWQAPLYHSVARIFPDLANLLEKLQKKSG